LACRKCTTYVNTLRDQSTGTDVIAGLISF
jgi:hypothetical protein